MNANLQALYDAIADFKEKCNHNYQFKQVKGWARCNNYEREIEGEFGRVYECAECDSKKYEPMSYMEMVDYLRKNSDFFERSPYE